MQQTLSPERVRADVAELLDCDPAEIAPDENLVDLGLDSVRIMTLVGAGAPPERSRWSFPTWPSSPNSRTGPRF